jgi:hypothetical protein
VIYAQLALALVRLANVFAARAHDGGVYDAGRAAELLRAHEQGAALAQRARAVARRVADPSMRDQLRDITTRDD